MVFEVFHFPYNRADHPADWDLVSSIHEDTDVIQALYLNHLVSDLRFQLTIQYYIMNKNNSLKRTGVTPESATNLFEEVRQRIITLRDCQVILDYAVAELYGVETREVNQAVRNNPDKFPDGYVLEVDKQEFAYLRSKDLIANISPKSRTLPKAFTEKGLYMLATILKSKQAVNVTFAIIETFATVRQLKSELRALHNETDSKTQQTKMQRFGEMLSNIVMPDLETSETESSLEINFLIGKIKHTVKRVKRQNDIDHTEVE